VRARSPRSPASPAQTIEGPVDADPPRGGAVHDDPDGDGIGGGLDSLQVEFGRSDRGHRGDDRRKVLGRTPRHHRVDGDALDARRAEARRNVRHDLVPRAARPGEHPFDALDRRRHDGQAVAPAARVIEPVDRLDVVRRLEQGGALVTRHWISA
jgi:hypothetical protein